MTSSARWYYLADNVRARPTLVRRPQRCRRPTEETKDLCGGRGGIRLSVGGSGRADHRIGARRPGPCHASARNGGRGSRDKPRERRLRAGQAVQACAHQSERRRASPVARGDRPVREGTRQAEDVHWQGGLRPGLQVAGARRLQGARDRCHSGRRRGVVLRSDTPRTDAASPWLSSRNRVRSNISSNVINRIPCNTSVRRIQASLPETRTKPDRSRVTYGGHIICYRHGRGMVLTRAPSHEESGALAHWRNQVKEVIECLDPW